jgi:phosphocarrier protein FPr
MVVGLGPGVSALAEGTLVALDGRRGRVWVSPGADTAAQLQAQREAWLASRQAARAVSQRPAVTRDGRKVRVLANIARLADVRPALENGAEGVGVLRTEFLYRGRVVAPSEEEQAATYRAIAEALGPRPLVIRTLDAGGDKPLAYLQMEQEANPFLGWRGLRVSLDRPDMFLTQLRAILRASPGYRIEIMFPMVSTVSEVRAAKALLAEAQRGLRQANIPFDEAMKVGIMIEVPSAVVVADRLAAEVDFFSIGTNDLCQYAVAADRTNPRVAALTDPFQPAILRLIRWTIQAAHRAGIWAALCGEFAGDPLGTPLLLGMGLDEWSMGIPAIPAVKQAIAQLTIAETEAMLAEALSLDSAEAVRKYVMDHFPDLPPSS